MDNRQSLHNLFITIHAGAAALCFLLSLLLLFSPRYSANKSIFIAYWWSLLGFLIFLLAAMVVYWPRYVNIEKIIFTGLLGLAGYMLYRASKAGQRPENRKSAFIDDIGFNLISFFEGFIIVSLLKSTIWIIVLSAVVGYFAGRYSVSIAKQINAAR